MASLTEIREGLAEALEKVDFDMQVSAYIRGNASPPFAQVVPDETEYHQAMGNGAETWGLVVQIVVALGTDEGAQRVLDEMLESDGALSAKAALEADQSLGGLVSGVTVERTSGYRTYRLGATQAEALGAEWTVSVFV